MNRLIEYTVFSAFVTAWRLATCPTKRLPVFANATTEGGVRPTIKGMDVTKLLKVCCYLGFPVGVNVLNFGDVFRNRLSRVGVAGIPAFIPFHAFPQTELTDVVSKDPHSKFDVVLNFEEVYPFLIGLLAPRRQVDLHDPYGITTGYGEGV